MKTRTIFDAWNLASSINDTYSIPPIHRERQAVRFYRALLARIEAGDRARARVPILEEALADALRIARENANEYDQEQEP